MFRCSAGQDNKGTAGEKVKGSELRTVAPRGCHRLEQHSRGSQLGNKILSLMVPKSNLKTEKYFKQFNFDTLNIHMLTFYNLFISRKPLLTETLLNINTADP